MGFVLCWGLSVAACGQNTPDRLPFALPTSSLEISSRNAQWRAAPATGVIPNMVCGGPQALATDCCSPPAPLPTVDCEQYPLACDPASNFCALSFDVQVGTKVDLVAQVAEVGAVDGRVFTSVSLLSLSTSTSNLPALPIRSASLYIAPGDASGVSDPATVFVAEVSLGPGPSPVDPSPEARQAFSGFSRDYRAPFSLWLSVHVVVPNGSTPAGTVSFEVKGRAEAVY
jgi:hypothetical protein